MTFHLYDETTDEHLGEATPEQRAASYATDDGIILIGPDGRVLDASERHLPTREVYVL